MMFIRANLLSFLALAMMMALSLLLYGELPEDIPSEFNFAGEVQDTQSRQVIAGLLPAIYLGTILLVNLLIKISPQKFSMPNSKRPMDTILFGVGALFFAIHAALLLNNGDFDFYIQTIGFGVAAFFIITGNVFGKTERNFFIGVRTPWSIDSAANWRATHHLAGKLMVVSGLILLVINFFISNAWLLLVISLTPVVVPVFYSYFYYAGREKDLEREKD